MPGIGLAATATAPVVATIVVATIVVATIVGAGDIGVTVRGDVIVPGRRLTTVPLPVTLLTMLRVGARARTPAIRSAVLVPTAAIPAHAPSPRPGR
jgi:hypothetical protein